MKQPLLLLHGALGSAQEFAQLLPILEENYTVHTLNFQGHGGIPSSPKGFDLKSLAQTVEAYIEKHQLFGCDVFGYSMGGYIALYLAQEKAGIFGKIITLATKLAWTPCFAQQEVKKLQPTIIEEKVPHFAQYLQQLHNPTDWRILMEQTADFMLSLGNDKGLIENKLTEIKTPTLICLGSEDRMVTIEESQALALQLKQGQFLLLEGVKHPLNKVPRELLVNTIKIFLEN